MIFIRIGGRAHMIARPLGISVLSFQIGNSCNYSNLHNKCPINHIPIQENCQHLSTDKIVKTIEAAQKLGFSGHVNFHFYNEPLLNLDNIVEIINRKKECKYMVWTNGSTLSREVENNQFLNLFDYVAITCYQTEDIPFYNDIKNHYKNIYLFESEFDDRLNGYTRNYQNNLSCKRVQYEMPIDYYGNIHLCCFDWKNSYPIGNIFELSLEEIVNSEKYQSLYSNNRLLDLTNSPDICKNCDKIWVRLPNENDGALHLNKKGVAFC